MWSQLIAQIHHQVLGQLGMTAGKFVSCTLGTGTIENSLQMHMEKLSTLVLITIVTLVAVQDSLCLSTSTSGPGYKITGHLANYPEKTIYFGYYHADKQFLLDTADVIDGSFVFSGDTDLKSGVYLIVMPPKNTFFQVLLDEENPQLSFTGDNTDLSRTLRFENSEDNSLFYENLRYIGEKRVIGDELAKRMEATQDEGEKATIQSEIDKLTQEVLAFQEGVIQKAPQSMTAALIRSGFNIDIPEYQGTPEEIQNQKYLYYKKHYFDHVDLGDERLLRSPKHVLADRVNYYLEKLTPQHPDSISVSLDYLLEKMKPAQETYRYYVVKFLNQYASSKYVGQDAVFVHLAEKYFDGNKAPWVDEKQLNKILDNARLAKPTLIGKKAPNFVVQRQDGTDIQLSQITADHTVLVFWAHDCGHCQESMPELAEFYEQYKGSGIEVLAVCTKINKDEPACWDFVNDKGIGGFLNASDQKGGRSYIHSLYDIKKTPKLYVLDRDKTIVTKGIGVENLVEFFKQKGVIDSD